MRTHVIALGLCAALLSSIAASAQTRKPTLEEDLAAIAAFNAKYLKALNDEDIETLASLTTDDHILISSGRAPASSRLSSAVARARSAWAAARTPSAWSTPASAIATELSDSLTVRALSALISAWACAA